MRKVVVTGIGMINSLGNNADECFDGLLNKKLGISEVSSEITEASSVKFAGLVKDYNPTDHFNKRALRSFDLVNQYGILAAREAAIHANIQAITNRDRIGCNVTSGIGGMSTIEKEILNASEKGFGRISPSFIPKAIINLVAGNIAIDLKCNGICNSVVTACASSTDAIGHAKMYIESNMADVMITGGSEACVNKTSLAGFNNLGALSRGETVETASIPFDVNRSGFVMGEGASVLVLEEEQHAINRGAKILGYIEGYGATCDANHITAPDPEAEFGVKAVNIALNQANIIPTDVRHINCHGTSTPLNDAGEVKLLSKVYQEDINIPTITSTKSNTGHLLGAAGSTEAAFCIMSLNKKVITPTINTKQLDETCVVDVCLDEVRENDSEYAMSLSLGFGGHNSCIVMKKGPDA